MLESDEKGIVKAKALREGSQSLGDMGVDWVELELSDGRKVLFYQECTKRSVDTTEVSSDSPLTAEEADRIAEDAGHFFGKSKRGKKSPKTGKNKYSW